MEEKEYFFVLFNKIIEHPKYYARFLTDIVSINIDNKSKKNTDC